MCSANVNEQRDEKEATKGHNFFFQEKKKKERQKMEAWRERKKKSRMENK